jgi:hypothetical protein
MARRHVWLAAVSTLIVALGVAAPVAADPPGRAARLNYYRGAVSFRPASLEEWGPATVNYPLTTGDRLWTDSDATAELHIGSSIVRLAPYTAFAILNLDDRSVQVRLSEGTADIVIGRLDYGEQFEVDTPSSAVALVTPGVYRIDVGEDGSETRVTVRRGDAEMFADQTEFRVYQGQTGTMSGVDDPRGDVVAAAAPDSWERWCRTRDEREARSVSLQYVSQEMVGYEDLDDYGVWSSEPEYGAVWRPRAISAGWAPYRYGHWAWVEPWGWTWVDEAPWGFAPFHYGRWACLRGDWFWVPGAYVARPYYAPALVAFIGGDDWGFSFGFGVGPAIGWFPLGPREIYYPAYRASYGYLRNVNITHVNITNINVTNFNVWNITYVNRAIVGAVTAVPRDAFLTARSLRGVARPVSGHAVDRADVVGMTAPVAPRLDSVLGQRGVRVSRRAQDALNRPVVARATPPAAVASFQARQRLLQASGGRPVDDAALTLRQGTSDGLPVKPLGMARARGNDGAPPADDPTGTGTPQRRGVDRGNADPTARPSAADDQAAAARQARPRYDDTSAADPDARTRSQVRPDQGPAGSNRPPSAGQARPRTDEATRENRVRSPDQDRATPNWQTDSRPPNASQERRQTGEFTTLGIWARPPGQNRNDAGQSPPQNRPSSAGDMKPRGSDTGSRDVGMRSPNQDRPAPPVPNENRPTGASPAGPRGGDTGSRDTSMRSPGQGRPEPGQAAPQNRPSSAGEARPRRGDGQDASAPARAGRPEPQAAPPSRPSGTAESRPRRGRGGTT